VKQAFRLLCLAAVLGFFWLSYNTVKAQSTSTTPDSFVAQVSNGSSDSFANDINGNGRVVVIKKKADN
jgi:hypothetical protein